MLCIQVIEEDNESSLSLDLRNGTVYRVKFILTLYRLNRGGQRKLAYSLAPSSSRACPEDEGTYIQLGGAETAASKEPPVSSLWGEVLYFGFPR